LVFSELWETGVLVIDHPLKEVGVIEECLRQGLLLIGLKARDHGTLGLAGAACWLVEALVRIGVFPSFGHMKRDALVGGRVGGE